MPPYLLPALLLVVSCVLGLVWSGYRERRKADKRTLARAKRYAGPRATFKRAELARIADLNELAIARADSGWRDREPVEPVG